MESVTFYPIGTVQTENGKRFIALDRKYLEATLGLEEFSHILVLWWFHLYDNKETRNYLVMDKPYTHGPEKIGVLATRGPIRPNPVAVTACPLVHVDRDNGRIVVECLDAEDGTPVLDIKPYEPSDDRVRDVTMPKWCRHWPDCLEANEGFDWGKEFNFHG